MNLVHRVLLSAFVGFWSVWLFNNINPWLGIGVFGGYSYYLIKSSFGEK